MPVTEVDQQMHTSKIFGSGLIVVCCIAAVTDWIKKQNIFPGRVKPNTGYNWKFTRHCLTRSLNACHLTLGLAYIHAKVRPLASARPVLGLCLDAVLGCCALPLWLI